MDEKQKLEIARLEYETLRADAEKRIGYQVDLAQSALKTLTLANGGAIVALFTLLGNLDKAKLAIDPNLIWWAFAAFVIGLIATFISYFGAFFSQGFYMVSSAQEAWEKQSHMLGLPAEFDHQSPYKKGNVAEKTGIAAAMLGLLGFIAGSGIALAAVLI